MYTQNRARWIAILITILLVIILLMLLMGFKLIYTGEQPRVWPPEDTSELLLEGEYVKYGDSPDFLSEESTSDNSADELSFDSDDILNSSEPAEEMPLPITSTQESPATVQPKPTPEKTGPSEAELAELERVKKQQDTQQQINNRVQFTNDTPNKGSEGKTGSPEGTPNAGVVSGKASLNLKGREFIHVPEPIGSKDGSIIISIEVSPDGKVKKATVSGGTGLVFGEMSARESCVQAALKAKINSKMDAPDPQFGTITFRFK